jgi:hypothetical protein
VPNARTVHQPGATAEPGLVGELVTATPDEVDQIVSDYEFDISAIDDDRPFFWHFTPFRDVLTDWDRSFEDSEIAIGERLLIVLLGISAVVAAVMLSLPFAATRRDRGATVRGRGWFFVYFAALGLGFMFIEISMIQRFALLLGYPTLSLSVSLFTLLLATAAGARLSGVVRRWRARALPVVTGALAVIAGTYVAISGPLTDAALAWPQWARILVVFVLLFPVGLLLGVFLPTGMDAAVEAAEADGADRGRLVAWCWAVNGFFSVLGASLTTIISMSFGFDRAILAGLVLYVVATIALGLHPRPTEPETVLTTSEAGFDDQTLPTIASTAHR